MSRKAAEWIDFSRARGKQQAVGTCSIAQDTHLQNQETVVVQVDATLAKQRCDFFVGALLAIDEIVTLVVAVGSAADDKLGARDNCKVIRVGNLEA